MELFVRAGVPLVETLRIATRDAAAFPGATDLGTLTPGARTDLVLLDSDPLVDLRNLQAIWRVVKGGWVFDPLTSASLTRNSAQHIMLGRDGGCHEAGPDSRLGATDYGR